LNVAKEKLFTPGREANLDLVFRVSTESLIEKVETALKAFPGVEHFSGEQIMGNPVVFGKSEDTNAEVASERPLSYLINNIGILTPGSFLEGIENVFHFPYALRLGPNEIQINPPANYHNSRGGYVVVDFESDVWDRYPRSGRAAELIERSSWFSKYGLTAVRSNVTSHPDFISFSLPGERESLKAHFAEKGYTIGYSKEEQYSDAFINTIGGIRKIDILASRSALKLIDMLTFKSSKKVAQYLAKQFKLYGREEEIESVIPSIELPDEERTANKTFDEREGWTNCSWSNPRARVSNRDAQPNIGASRPSRPILR
jgi:hypothetical protein